MLVKRAVRISVLVSFDTIEKNAKMLFFMS